MISRELTAKSGVPIKTIRRSLFMITALKDKGKKIPDRADQVSCGY
jgi:hypothetical protein